MEFAFILKKIISQLIMPLSIGLFIFFAGIIFLYLKKYTKAKLALIVSFLWISIFSYTQFSDFLLQPLESQYQDLIKVPKDVKYILLLGGDSKNRAWKALQHYHSIPNSKIITSGYKGHRKIAEATRTANLLISIGTPKEDIIIHNEPKDTKEEAIKIKELLGKEKFILITSASHMPRAMALFKAHGLNAIASPTARWIKEVKLHFSMPNGYNLNRSDKAWHEYIGLLWAKIKSQI